MVQSFKALFQPLPQDWTAGLEGVDRHDGELRIPGARDQIRATKGVDEELADLLERILGGAFSEFRANERQDFDPCAH